MVEFDNFLGDFGFDQGDAGHIQLPYVGGNEATSMGDALSTISDGDRNLESRRLKQLERNRETAKRCRKRKRERTEALMDEVTRLRETNRKLEIQLKICQSKLGKPTTGRGNRGEEEEHRRIAEMKRIGQMVAQGCPDGEIEVRLKSFFDVYSDFGEERRRVLRTQVTQMEGILMPTKISKMLLWILEQDDEFFRAKDGSSIWNTLCREINVDDQQKKAFLAQRNRLGKQNSGIKQTIHKLKNLEAEIVEGMDKRKDQITEITNVFTPSQQAKFLGWVEKNEACVHLLDNLWKQRTNNEKDAQGPVAKTELGAI